MRLMLLPLFFGGQVCRQTCKQPQVTREHMCCQAAGLLPCTAQQAKKQQHQHQRRGEGALRCLQ